MSNGTMLDSSPVDVLHYRDSNEGGTMTTAIDGKLITLAARANEAHANATNAAQSMVEYAIEAGEALNEAKAEVGHGGWLTWLAENFEGSTRLAQTYMRLANAQSSAHLDANSIDEALAAIAEPKEDSGSNGEDSEPKSDTAKIEETCKKIGGALDSLMPTMSYNAEDLNLLKMHIISLSGRLNTILEMIHRDEPT